MKGRGKVGFRSLIGWVILASLGAVAFFLWQAMVPAPGAKDIPANPDVAADLKLNRVHYTETREGIMEWEVEAASAAYYREKDTVLLEDIRGVFYGKNRERYELAGARGRFHPQTRVIEVFDGVEIQASQGYRMKTKSLQYRGDLRQLQTSDPVEIKSPEMQVQGIGMVVELNRECLRILGGVTTTLTSSSLSSLDWKKSSQSAR